LWMKREWVGRVEGWFLDTDGRFGRRGGRGTEYSWRVVSEAAA
jgi:hypothetical protein